ncbi:hypothetical protein [Rothia nasimurium]|uniref:hypothetical protein n=1 Tax=Rothia nasimurium TaxID=85336 RepID=UPI001F2951DF|nr:hypothetical protein [Rothia nasimurium]
MLKDIDNIKFIHPFSRVNIKPDLVILDTNILIKLCQLFYNGSTNETTREKLSLALQQIPATRPQDRANFIEVNYGYALYESATNRKGDFKLDQYLRNRFAIEEIISWDKDQISRYFKDHRPLSRYSKKYKKNHNRPVKGDAPSTSFMKTPFPFIVSGYLYFLKIAELNERQDLAPEEKFKTYIDWMNQYFRVSYFINLGSTIFLCSNQKISGKAKKIFKYSGKSSSNIDKFADSCWNGAWDVFLTGLTEMSTTGQIKVSQYKDHPYTVLLTENKDPELLREEVSVDIVIEFTDSITSTIMNLELNMDEKYREMGLHEYAELSPFEATQRQFRKIPDDMEDKLIKERDKLEKALGIITN